MRRLPLRRPLLERVHHGPFARQAPDVWEYFLGRWGAAPMAAVARRALLLHRVDLRRLLPAIRQPVLLVCGDRDPLVDRACERVLLDGLPDVTRVELSGSGHVPMFTHPDVLAEVLHRFLTPLPCAAGICRPALDVLA
jgi:pimeloyl-ACP methyl ester carboxylesterase